MTPPERSLVSVVIAVLNNAASLGRCLDSIRSQEHPVQAVVIDGGSADGSRELIESNSGWIGHWESSPDRGIYSAWNKALPHCTGRWVAFLGADDYFLDPRAVGDLAELGDREEADLVCGRVWYVDPEGRRQFLHGQPWDWERMTRQHSVAHTGMLHRAELFDRYGGFDESLKIAGDYEFLLRLGPRVRACFLDRAYLAMGNSGVSSRNLAGALSEVRRIQSRRPGIGPGRALVNYSRSLSEHLYWSARRAVDGSRLVSGLKERRNSARQGG